MRDRERLRAELSRIDGRGYKAYKAIAGAYDFGEFELHIDHVQGDPFAAPSRLRARVSARAAAFPAWALESDAARTALADFLTRQFSKAAARGARGHRGSGKSGLVEIETPAQEILPRTSVVLGKDWVEARFLVGLPAQGRRVLGREAEALLLREVPSIVAGSLFFASVEAEALRLHCRAVADQRALRAALAPKGLVAFVGDGARLPRRSGIDPRPMEGRVIELESPESLAVELPLADGSMARGLGIPEGVTLIVGGGYHGKSTLLEALELGVYDHVPGDGRDRVVTRDSAVAIRAEDGRRVEKVGIDPFIRNLPLGRDTAAFCSEDASGSTSQATNIIEALEVGAGALFIDEDTSATNFMIRDHRMQSLVARNKEPITPFIDKVSQLYRERGVSSVIVIGGSGDYFDVADTVVMMDEYVPHDVTADARAIAERFRELRRPEGGERFGEVRARRPRPQSLDPSRGRREVKVDVKGVDGIGFGTYRIDLSAVEQLVEVAQTRTIGRALLALKEDYLNGGVTLEEALARLEAGLSERGLDLLARGRDGGLAHVRRFEIAAALNRLRSLDVA